MVNSTDEVEEEAVEDEIVPVRVAEEVPVTVAEELAGLVEVEDVLLEVPVGQTHPLAAKLVIGGTVQVAWADHETIEEAAGVSANRLAWIRTGMTAPVAKLKVR